MYSLGGQFSLRSHFFTHNVPLNSQVRSLYGKFKFPSFYVPSVKGTGHENKEGRKRGYITRLIRCLLYGFVDYSGKGTK